jgi:hypothetical protein
VTDPRLPGLGGPARGGRDPGQATAGLARRESLSDEARTARSICAVVGGLQKTATVTAANAPSAAPKKKPNAHWKLAVPTVSWS